MDMANDLVEPLATAGAVPVVESTSPETAPKADASAGKLPDELIQLPAFQALFSGQPPALSGSLKELEKRPEAKLVASNKEALLRSGIGFYRSLGGDLGVLFNQLYIHPSELQAADKAGKLQEIAPPIDTVAQGISKSGKDNPVLAHSGKLPAGFKGAPVSTPPQSSSGGAPLPASAQKKVTGARITNLQPGAPTSGPAPGAGRLLNEILKPVL